MCNLPLISVIIPVYNAEHTIVRALASVVNQTYKNIEIIVIDDASTDQSLDVVKREFCNFELVILRNAKNQGVSYSRNLGVKNASGGYVAFLDADDEWYPEKCQIQIASITSNNADVCSTSYKRIGGKKDRVIHVPEGYNLSALAARNYVGLSTTLIKKNLLIEYPFRDIGHEDLDLWVRLMKNGVRFNFVKEILVNYFVTKNSLSSGVFSSFIWHYQVLRNNQFGLLNVIFYQSKYFSSIVRERIF